MGNGRSGSRLGVGERGAVRKQGGGWGGRRVGAGWEGRSGRTGGHRGREARALTPGGQAGKRGQLLRRASTPSEAEEDRATPAPQGNVAMRDWRESHFLF